MFGPLSAHGSVARRARRMAMVIALVVLIVILVIAELIVQVVRSQTQVTTRTDRAYVAAMVPIVSESNGQLSLLAKVRSAPGDLGTTPSPRAELNAWLSELSSDAASTNESLQSLGLAAPSSRAAALIAEVLTDRMSVTNDLQAAVAAATTGSAPQAASLLSQVAVGLSSSDTAYRSFVSSLPKNESAPKLPSSIWDQRALWDPSARQRFAQALSSARFLQATAAVRIVAIGLSPPAVSISGVALPTTTTTTTTTTSTSTTTTTTTLVAGATGSNVVNSSTTSIRVTTTLPPTTTTNQIPPAKSVSDLPSTGSVGVTAVISNAGNVALSQVAVAVDCVVTNNVSAKKKAIASSLHEIVDSLSVGGSRYLNLGEIPTVSGASYTLIVTATPKVGTPARDEIKIVIG